MNILVISHTYIAPINRDKWKTLATMYPNCQLTILFPQKWPTHLFTHEAKNLEHESLSNCSFIALDTFFAGNEVLYFYRPMALLKLLKRLKPDIIHVEQGDNAFSYFQTILFSKLLHLKSKFLFFTWINWQHQFSLKYRLFWRFIEKTNLNSSSGAITGNHDAQKILLNKKFSKPIMVLPQLGVNLTIFIPSKNNKPTALKIIGYIGRLVEEKGVALLINAFSHLEKIYPDWRLLIVGGGPEETSLKALAIQQRLINKIDFLHPVSHHDVAQFLHRLNILVLPSYDTPRWKEQFGHIIIEAMASGIPVIGSSAGEIPNVIKNAGLIFEQQNLQSLLESLRTLMQDEQLRTKFGTAGLQHVQKHYSHQAIAQATYEFWQSLN